jgi:hypothetical protein
LAGAGGRVLGCAVAARTQPNSKRPVYSYLFFFHRAPLFLPRPNIALKPLHFGCFRLGVVTAQYLSPRSRISRISAMSSLNTSSNGPNITRSYQSIVNAAPPSGPQASSPTYGQWAVFTVQAPLVSAFQQDGGKESVLKVQSTGGMSISIVHARSSISG